MTSSATAALAAEDLLAPLELVARERTYPARSVTAQVTEHADGVAELEPQRLYQLLTPALCSKVPHLVLQWLRDTGLLLRILPELDATVEFSQESGRKHKDVWEHTKAVVWQAVPRPNVRWAAVLHDIGKVKTRRFMPGGKVTFHGHADEGVRLFRRGPAGRIGFPGDAREIIEQLIRHHLRPGQYDGTWTDSAVRRFARECEPFLVDLLDLSRADVTSKRPGKRMRALTTISELSRRIRTLQAEDARTKPLPAGLGNLLMSALGLPPGKHIGELRAKLVALYEAREIEGGREPEYYVDAVRSRGLLDGVAIVTVRGWPE